MRSPVDAAGRVVIPSTAMTLVRRSSGAVAVPAEKLPALTDDLVRDTLERTRR